MRRSRVSVLNPPAHLRWLPSSEHISLLSDIGEVYPLLTSPTGLPRPPKYLPPQPSQEYIAHFWRSWNALGRSWDALGTLLDALGRSWVLFFDKNHSKRAPKRDFRRSWLDFQLIFVPQTVDFHYFPVLVPSTARTFSKKTRATKNLRKP